MILRAYVFDPPGSYGAGGYQADGVTPKMPAGAFNTGRINLDAPPGQACLNPDPQQFTDSNGKTGLQLMTEYAAAHGEVVRQFANTAAVASVCGGEQPIQAAPVSPPNPPPVVTGNGSITAGSSGGSSCLTGLCSPAGPSGGGNPGATTSTTPPGSQVTSTNAVAATTASGQTVNALAGRTTYSPGSGSLTGKTSTGGTTTGNPVSTPTGAGGTTTGGTATTTTPGTFNIKEFITGPLGIMALVLVVIILALK